MFVGVARIVLQLPGARTLKDRRQVVRSFKERVRARGAVSIAEVGDLERPGAATLGVAAVAADSAAAHRLLATVVELARTLPDAVLADVATEVASRGQGGAGLASDLGRGRGGSARGAPAARDEAPPADAEWPPAVESRVATRRSAAR
ncbi:MAG: DUF503 domain-containing protein [Polyangiaceae bacterium]|nr:DUF503 domain-containing protein [Polyangiaceae bacterium]